MTSRRRLTVAKIEEVLIDGDILLYRFGHASQDTFEFDDGVMAEAVAPFEFAYTDMQAFIRRICDRVKVDDCTIILSGDRNFRYSVLPSYKWNRKQTPKPLLYNELREQMLEDYICLEQSVLEGDDLMGIISTSNPGKYCLASIDKDLMQIPGWHYNWNTDKKARVTKRVAEYFFYRQILTGDPGDGYTGIPGVGPVRADKILGVAHSPVEYWDAVLSAYLEAGLTEDDALTQARVARILQKDDYDFQRGEVKLWTPTPVSK
jgi:5'-3' exonuclease